MGEKRLEKMRKLLAEVELIDIFTNKLQKKVCPEFPISLRGDTGGGREAEARECSR